MGTLYLDCGMGAAGDMLAAALLELIPEKNQLLTELNHLGLPGVHMALEPSEKCGIVGAHFSVTVRREVKHSQDHHSHFHSGIADIIHLVEHMNISQKGKRDILNVYRLIAQAESAVHGVPVEQTTFMRWVLWMLWRISPPYALPWSG